jgi:hypothetical protein
MQRRDRVRQIRTRRTALRSLLRIRTIRIIRIRTLTIRMRRRIIRTPARTRAEFRLRRIRLRIRALPIQVHRILARTQVPRIQAHRIPVLPAAAVRLPVPDALNCFCI